MVFWDMLYQRYSNPMALLQQMLDTGELPEFIDSVIGWHNDEKEENWLWEYWLHKVFEQPFDEFVRQSKPQDTSSQEIQESNLEATIKNSLDILNDFSVSFENKGGINGTI